jgi:hypothetical protein
LEQAVRTALRIAGIALGSIIVAALGFLFIKTKQYNSDRSEAEWIALAQSASAVSAGTVPNAWDVGLFISARGINSSLGMTEGARISYDLKEKPNEDSVLTIKKLRLANYEVGFPVVSLQLQAESKSRGLQIDLLGDATLAFSGIERTSEGKPLARFIVQPLRLEADLGWYLWRFGVRGYAAELLGTGLAVGFAEALRIDVPLPERPKLGMTIDRTDILPVREPKAENWVELHTQMSGGDVKTEISFGYPIFVDGGVWLGAAFRAGGQQVLPKLERGKRTNRELDVEIAELRKRLVSIKAPEIGASDVAVWLRGSGLEKVADLISHRPIEQRTATITSTRYQGQLAKKDWSDKILGNGGAFVELNKPDAVKGTAVLDELRGIWRNGQGLTVTAKERLAATVDIHVHVDPLIGGGVGTNVGMKGDAHADIGSTFGLTVMKVAGCTVLALLPRAECQISTFELRTDGKLVGDWGWTKVPQIGARLRTDVLGTALEPQIVLSDAPYIVRGTTDNGQPLPIESKGVKYRVSPAWSKAELVLVPTEARMSNDGYLVEIGIKVNFSQRWTDTTKEQEEQERAMRAQFKDTVKPSTCPGGTEFAVLLGDIEFGPNNEIVKWIRNAWNDITKGPGKNNEAVKILTAAT